ncbi:MAG TPA: aminotransferase class I/II-fold pyridoxal phosphate-dependent enzyme [Streptosporangiaceae bacterium]|nr:aminotransferase class I/II-fold pyridoxal phosphate-dependent enzyme [Streptosporangiaceae bacterium]
MTVPESPFDRLRDLLRDAVPPAGLEPIALHLGEPRLSRPPLDSSSLADPQGWSRYPPLGGTAALRSAYTGWLERRFAIGASLRDGRVAVEPTPGTKQAVSVAIMQAVLAAGGHGSPVAPAVVMPNPAYPSYYAATIAARARPVFYGAGNVDHVAEVAAAVRAAGPPVAAVVVCNPGNPQGDIIGPGGLRAIGEVARSAGAVLLADECYTDLSVSGEVPGYLPVAAQDRAAGQSFLVLHSLSKRSGAPGLRSGFMAGDPALVGGYATYNRACGVSVPGPVCAAAAALWADDFHVSQLRSALTRNWEVADSLLAGVPGYRRPGAGFFCWLPVADDERSAHQLWQRHAVSVMPGRYLAAEDATGANPGAGYLRIALVHDEDTTREALTRLRTQLTTETEMSA